MNANFYLVKMSEPRKMSDPTEIAQVLPDQIAGTWLSRRRFLMAVGAAGLTVGLSGAMGQDALAAGENRTIKQDQPHGRKYHEWS